MTENYQVQVNIRLNPGLRARIQDLAWKDRRSVNSLLVELLENYTRERLLNEK